MHITLGDNALIKGIVIPITIPARIL